MSACEPATEARTAQRSGSNSEQPTAFSVAVFVHVHVNVETARGGKCKQAIQQHGLVSAARCGIIVFQAAAVAARHSRAKHATCGGYRVRQRSAGSLVPGGNTTSSESRGGLNNTRRTENSLTRQGQRLAAQYGHATALAAPKTRACEI